MAMLSPIETIADNIYLSPFYAIGIALFTLEQYLLVSTHNQMFKELPLFTQLIGVSIMTSAVSVLQAITIYMMHINYKEYRRAYRYMLLNGYSESRFNNRIQHFCGRRQLHLASHKHNISHLYHNHRELMSNNISICRNDMRYIVLFSVIAILILILMLITVL